MTRLAVFLLPVDEMLVHPRATPSIKFAGTYLYTWRETCTVWGLSVLPKNTTQCPPPGRESGTLALESSALTMEPPRWPKKQKWSMDLYSFFLGWVHITEMCLRKVKWIAVSYCKTPTGVDFLQPLFPSKFISSLQLSRVLDFDSVTF